MSKYKLIKEYPGSVIKDTIVEVNQNGFATSLGLIFDPSTYPTYWEKVVEKDYEILSVKYIKPDNWLCGYKINQIVECKIENNKFKFKRTNGTWDSYDSDYSGFVTEVFSIHSIKRLSDSEIFTIGDNIDVETYKNNPFIITGFNLNYNNSDFILGDQRSCFLKDAIKSKTPLFTTEDGVGIFEGDTFYFIAGTNKHVNSSYGTLIASQNAKAHCALARFSTKEKAEEYILYNKPILSLENVLDIWTELSGYTKESLKEQSTLISKITEFTKNKLNS